MEPRESETTVALLADAFCDAFVDAPLWRGTQPSPPAAPGGR